MKKRLISLVLVLATLLSLCTIAVAANYTTSYSSYTTPSSSDYAYWSGTKVVKASGTTVSEIKWMQAALNYCIKYKGLSASLLDVDGSFGPASKKACLAFQKKYGLSQDGSFGPATIAKMKSVLRDIPIVKGKKPAVLENFQQTDSRWGSKNYVGSTITKSGCGVLSVVNAVYNLNGKFIEPTTVAKWAYDNKYYTTQGCTQNMIKAAASKYGNSYGFKCVGSKTGSSITAKDLQTTVANHMKSGGTCVINVYNHYMALVDYNASTGKFLVYDCAAGSGRRAGLTTQYGCWKTAADLTCGTSNNPSYPLHVWGYWLFSAT